MTQFVEIREKARILQVMEVLQTRKTFTAQEEHYLRQLTKGFEGEITFDNWIEKHMAKGVHLKDLTFKVNGTTFQVDSLLITNERIIMYEVKNYEGEYILKGNKLLKYDTEVEILNPTVQLERSSILLRQLLSQRKISYSIEAFVVYIHPNFTLYTSTVDRSILLLSLMNKHASKIQSLPCENNARAKDAALVKLLTEHSKENDPNHYQTFPLYYYTDLLKGVYCSSCRQLSIQQKYKKCVCQLCQKSQCVYDSISQLVREYCILFPEQKLTVNSIHDWAKKKVSPYSIRQFLKKNYAEHGSKRDRYYS
ncbi:nuclease-related domain-containing protein [Alkalibacterium sp. AK22]|uniref:nuclease-related domain-containing protein n=1 Tax=Alkalibacterium sp. AK22 TaxID=1229520 RepID=UPI0005567312|nr:nuclease-related domain-containing protein [Alkalibacterium sp. AK22]